MDFKKAAILGTYISKNYAEDFFKLLVNYRDISASEAASRLGLHIGTTQDFLESMSSLDILEKVEVYEKKRPYFRYSLKVQQILMDIDLTEIEKERIEGDLERRIREKTNIDVSFQLSRDGKSISSIVIRSGSSRDYKEHRINLTKSQGIFVYNLPFPNSDFLSLAEIMSKGNLQMDSETEVLDIVDLLMKKDVIEEG